MQTSILVIGVGNDYRSDDGVGLAVVRTPEIQHLPETVCIEWSGDGVALMERWSPTHHVILIDAVSSGARPGTMYRWRALAQPLPPWCSFLSSHAYGIREALQLAQTLHRLPASMMIYGIEGETFVIGTALSPAVTNAVRKVATSVIRDIQELSRDHISQFQQGTNNEE